MTADADTLTDRTYRWLRLAKVVLVLVISVLTILRMGCGF